MSLVTEMPVAEDERDVLSRPATPPDETVAYGPNAENIADVRYGGERAAGRPLVVFIHGGFWRPRYDRLHLGPMAAALAEAGWTVANTEYRRVPQHPNLTIDDISLALQMLPGQVKKYDGRVIAVGHSAGGHLALWAASRRPTPRLHGALALAPAADLQLAYDMELGEGAALAFLGEPPAARADLDPKKMPSPTIATTIIHGDADDTVPISVAESYAMAHPTVRFVKLPGSGHFGVIDPLSTVWPTVMSELERLAR
jgi:acetyl esterase/lipase